LDAESSSTKRLHWRRWRWRQTDGRILLNDSSLDENQGTPEHLSNRLLPPSFPIFRVDASTVGCVLPIRSKQLRRSELFDKTGGTPHEEPPTVRCIVVVPRWVSTCHSVYGVLSRIPDYLLFVALLRISSYFASHLDPPLICRLSQTDS
jgi:hypothetical protein